MPTRRITKTDFNAYLYLMQGIFPINSSLRKVLATKNDISKHYVPIHYDNPSFRKTLDRNWNLVKDIRAGGKIKEDYLPRISTVEILISYFLGEGKKQSLTDFAQNNESEIREFSIQYPISNGHISQIFPSLPEKIHCIEKRLDKIEEFIENHVQTISNRLNAESDVKFAALNESLGKDELTVEFLQFLQMEFANTKKQLKRAKYLYKNFGSFGLFLVPLKYTDSMGQSILDDFMDDFESLDNEDLIDDFV